MDFKFLQQDSTGRYVISAPRRAERPDAAHEHIKSACPFCPGQEGKGEEVYRVENKDEEGWLVRVIANKYPFAPIHEVIIHAPDHHKNFEELPLSHVVLILQTYRQRFNTHREQGNVYIFHNRGFAAGESIPHSHTQLAVSPFTIPVNTPKLSALPDEKLQTTFFSLFCPPDSEWPDEVWVAPNLSGKYFGDATDEELKDLSDTLQRLVRMFGARHGHEFAFNFYIYPKDNWYLRFIPRQKTLGGFELATGIMVNTQRPIDTFAFLEEHFAETNKEKIRQTHTADYKRHV